MRLKQCDKPSSDDRQHDDVETDEVIVGYCWIDDGVAAFGSSEWLETPAHDTEGLPTAE